VASGAAREAGSAVLQRQVGKEEVVRIVVLGGVATWGAYLVRDLIEHTDARVVDQIAGE